MEKLILMTKYRFNQIINERIEEALREENQSYQRNLLLKQANIAALQSQINPHFLYNTLECIRGMALMEDAEDVADVTWALSRFFRYSISSKSDFVTIWDELDNIQNYVTIQKYRFRNRFLMEIQCEEDVKEAIIPKLSIQPAVENAIIHGFSDITSGGNILIKVQRIDENIQIIIGDNGKGMDADKLAALCLSIRGAAPVTERTAGQHTGIGLQNIDKRFKLYFGNEYGVNVTSWLNVGTEVELILPFKFSVK